MVDYKISEMISFHRSYFCNHHKANEEATNTDGKEKKFTSMGHVEEGRVNVGNCSCESFQTYKLKQTSYS